MPLEVIVRSPQKTFWQLNVIIVLLTVACLLYVVKCITKERNKIGGLHK